MESNRVLMRAVRGLACLLSWFALAANASVITYDFTKNINHWNGKKIGETATFIEDGLSLTVTALEKNQGDWVSGAREVWEDGNKNGAKGLGVKGPSADNWEIDGKGRKEGLKFSFDWEVELKFLKTWFGDRNDDWNLSVWDGSDWDTILDDSKKSKYDDGGLWTTDFIVWADHKNDSLTVKKLMVHHKVSVPEPATVALLGLGLIGLIFTRRYSW